MEISRREEKFILSSMAASASGSISLRNHHQSICSLLLIKAVMITTRFAAASCCGYSSIISFGDSLADTGNLLHLNLHSPKRPHCSSAPYGETYFHHTTGRCSDGRLIIDFIAQHLGLPLVPPYIGGSSSGDGNSKTFLEGVNFAVGGSTALNVSYLEERGIANPNTNISLGVQLHWFKQMLASSSSLSLCTTTSSDGCQKLLKNSLVLMGEIGGNDYNHAFLFAGKPIQEVQSLVSPVVEAITSAIHELLELGAVTIMVPGNLPIGCVPAYLTRFNKTLNKEEDYDPRTGCITWLNKFSEYHNQQLQIQLDRIRMLHPNANIIYADYFNAAMDLYLFPHQHGFSKGALTACCGRGGPYNFNSSVLCGHSSSRCCGDPEHYVSWDGIHLTETAYKRIARGLLQGPYTIPHINTSCIASSVAKEPPSSSLFQ